MNIKERGLTPQSRKKTVNRGAIMLRILSYITLMLLLTSCASNTSRQNDYVISKNTVAEITLHDIEQIKKTGRHRTILSDEDVHRVFSWLASGDYERASKWLNQALSYYIDNSTLQFLNGLTYHLMSTQDVSKRPLAREGYMIAIRLDQNNWIAHRFLGILEMENKNYIQALNHLSEAALFNTDQDLLNDVGSAAYLARQPSIAAGVFKQLLNTAPNNQQYQSSYAVTLAALGLNEQALDSSTNIPAISRQYTIKRIDDWRAYHKRNPAPVIDSEASTNNLLTNDALLLAQFASSPRSWSESDTDKYDSYDGEEEEYRDQNDAKYSSDADDVDVDAGSDRLVVLDVVIIRSEEETRSSRGVNLLNGLRILFNYGQVRPGGHLRSQYDSPLRLANEGPGDGVERLVKSISEHGLEYSLNIANSTSDHNEVLARPSLIATDGKTSSFFSGLNIIAAAVSEGGRSGGTSIEIEKDIGVSLQVKPTFIEDGKIKLAIKAIRTFLTKPSGGVGFKLRVDTSKTEVNANVVMNIGDTLILSGLSEKETRFDRDGVPFLQDIPLIQYLFSRRTSLDFQRSVLILVTPRAPAYTNRNRNNINNNNDSAGGDDDGAGGSELNQINHLQSYYADWFVPYPNWASVFNHLESSKLYREFRTGDVTLESWQSKATLKSRLLEAIKFLYY